MASNLEEIVHLDLSDPSNVPLPHSPISSIKSSSSSMSSDSHSICSVSTATYERQEREAQELIDRGIEALCQELWRPPQSMRHRFLTSRTAARLRTNSLFRPILPEPEIPIVEHLHRGGFNHITAVRLPSSYDKEGYRDLIIRVPKEDYSKPDDQVAMLTYVRNLTSIPIPDVVASDFTCDNVLKKPYVIQQRIPGVDLESVWDDLSHPQRCTVAKAIGNVINSLLSAESPNPGVIEASKSLSDSKHPVVVPWKLESPGGRIVHELEPDETISANTTQVRTRTFNFFTDYLKRWRKEALASNLGEPHEETDLYDDMLKLTEEMDDLGLFKPDVNCLCHLDLHNPRNIMVKIDSDDSIEITGILDWDEAVVAPKFVNCHPPGWLWGYNKDDEVDERGLLPWPYELEGANKEPSSPEQQELKRLFESHAGHEYSRLAYDASSRLIRCLFRIATEGLSSSWFFTAAESMVKEWKEIRPSLVSVSSRQGKTDS